MRDKVVLDAASGSGYGSYIMSKFAKMVYGIDVSSEAVNYAVNNYNKSNIEFKVASIEQLPFKNSELDVIVSFETVEHVDFKIQKNEKKRNYHLKFLTKLVRIDLRVCKKFNKHT